MVGSLIKTSYVSKDVDVPSDFLRTEPPDAEPITFKQIDFASTPLPEFAGLYAVVLDHVLSPSECARLLGFAEASVSDGNRNRETGSAWSPALVNAGAGYEVSTPSYRNSDRIIWDNQDMVDRLWARLERVPQIRDGLLSFAEKPGRTFLRAKGKDGAAPRAAAAEPPVWDFHSVNKRMRFLKYGKDQFFRAHCDSPYGEVTADGHAVMTHYTLHLYLNDSRQEVGEKSELVGGATSFLSANQERKVDVDPKAGRVLVFQHRRLYHSGDEVKAGTKYTMRTDIMYRQRVSQPKPEEPIA